MKMKKIIKEKKLKKKKKKKHQNKKLEINVLKPLLSYSKEKIVLLLKH